MQLGFRISPQRFASYFPLLRRLSVFIYLFILFLTKEAYDVHMIIVRERLLNLLVNQVTS